MVISSRTPDGRPNNCPICGHSILIVPSPDTLDAPCPHCGHLLWFAGCGPLPIGNSSTTAEFSHSTTIPDAIEIAEHVLELIPKSLARDNLVLPLAVSADALLIAATAPVNLDTIERLRFILNRPVLVVPSTLDWISAQLDKLYGTVEDADVDAA